jgi:hypothetical protein
MAGHRAVSAAIVSPNTGPMPGIVLSKKTRRSARASGSQLAVERSDPLVEQAYFVATCLPCVERTIDGRQPPATEGAGRPLRRFRFAPEPIARP